MVDSKNILKRLISRYDYGGAFELLEELGFKETDLAILVNSGRYAVNFDFYTSKRILYDLSDELKDHHIVRLLDDNLQALINGEPDEIFSELIENSIFQIKNEEFIDYLGRIYRFREAIFKYMFVKKHMNRKSFSLHQKVMEKRQILKILRKQYHINNGNVVYAIVSYINKYCEDNYKFNKVMEILTSDKMNDLIDLRNSSIVGHGFIGASIDDIQQVYGNPMSAIDDFRECLDILGFKIKDDKYVQLNELMIELLKEM